MAGSAGLRGDVNTQQIKLGAGRVFVGTPAATFDGTAKFDTSAPASGWSDLGCISNDVTLNMTSELFVFRSGVPATRKKILVIGREGTLQVNFEEFNALVAMLAMGIAKPINKVAATALTVSASPPPTASKFTLSAVTGLVVGDQIGVETVVGDLTSTINTGIIKSISTNEIELYSALPKGAPTTGDSVKEINSQKVSFGGGTITEYPLIFVQDFLGGSQAVHFFALVASQANFNYTSAGGRENQKTQITFELHGGNDTDTGEFSLDQVFFFEAVS